MKKQLRLYNVFFPIWLLWLFPVTWVAVLPANFLVDFLVLWLTMRHLGLANAGKTARSVILKTWLFGFLADFIGTACMFLSMIITPDESTAFGRWWNDSITAPVAYSPFDSPAALAWIAACVALTGVCIYWFNRKICLKKLDIEESLKKKLALSLAVFTAPYLFFVPSAWFYQF